MYAGFEQRETSIEIPITLIDDKVAEPTATLFLRVDGVFDAEYQVPPTVTDTITDDD